MPFFSRRKSKKKAALNATVSTASAATSINAASVIPTTNKTLKDDSSRDQSKLVFHCQLAHGSPTAIVSGFTNVRELYRKIADCFEIDVSTILFCTLNTHRIEMAKLLGGQIGLSDFIFAHVKGQAKEIVIVKSEQALGLTITDNGAGYTFIKRITEGSVVDRLKNVVKVGDHIERINEKSVINKRHFDVAKMLKDIPVGSSFKMRVIEPLGGFQIEAAKRGRKTGDIQNGTKTLRFKADGKATIEEIDDSMVKAIERINNLLETYMNISDSELAQQIWDLSLHKKNPSDFATAIFESEIGMLNFPENFIFDLWAAIDDIKVGRVQAEDEVQNERL